MPTESALQLSAVEIAGRALDLAIMKAALAAPTAPRKRGPKPMPPRLVERPSKSDGPTILYIRDVGGYEETTYQTLENRAEAERRLRRYVILKEARALAIVNPRATKVHIALENLVRAERPLPGASRKKELAYAALCTRVTTLTVFFNQTTFGELTKDRINDFVEWRASQPDARYRPDVAGAPLASVASAGVDLVVLRKAVKLLHDELDLSWMPKIHIPKVDSFRRRHLTRAEMARMLWAVRGRVWDHAKRGWATDTVVGEDGVAVERRVLRPAETREARRILRRFIALGYHTGTRHESLREMSWIASSDKGCLDVEARIIHRQGFGTDPAKGKPQHTSEISEKFASMARRWRDRDLALGIKHVIHQPNGVPYRSRVKFIWACVVADAGLDDEVLPHVLRHTAATHLRMAGVHPRATADALGMSIQTVMRVYAHWSIEGAQSAATVLAYGKGIKRSIALEGLSARAQAKPAIPASRPVPAPAPGIAEDDTQLVFDFGPVSIDDGQIAFDFVPMPAPVAPVTRESRVAVAPALPIPTGPFQPPEPIVPPPPKVHPTHLRRLERRTRAKLGIAARGRVGLPPVPRFPDKPVPGTP